MSRNRAIFEMLLCAALWSIAGIFIKLIPWNSVVIAGVRSLIAGLVMFVYMRSRGIRYTADKRSLLGGGALCVTLTFFVAANKLTTAANSIVLQFTAPIFIVVFSALFFKKRFSRADILAVGLTMVGHLALFLRPAHSGAFAGQLRGPRRGHGLRLLLHEPRRRDGERAHERHPHRPLSDLPGQHPVHRHVPAGAQGGARWPAYSCSA